VEMLVILGPSTYSLKS